jgi:hypothetical protein
VSKASRTMARFLVAAISLVSVFAAVEPSLAYPAGQNLTLMTSAMSVTRAGNLLSVSTKNVQPGCTVNFSWAGQPNASTASAVANSLGLTPRVSLATPPIAAKYTLVATLAPCPANSGATTARASITVGRITKITCIDTASNYSARTSPVLRHDCYLKWGSRPVAYHNLKVRLYDPKGTRISWHIYMTDAAGAIHLTLRNKVSSAGVYVFDTYYSQERTYITNSLHTSIAMNR